MSLNSILYSRGGNTNAITLAPREPAISRNTVKSGMMRAIPVTKMITVLRIRTLLSLALDPVLKNGCCSAISKAARI